MKLPMQAPLGTFLCMQQRAALLSLLKLPPTLGAFPATTVMKAPLRSSPWTHTARHSLLLPATLFSLL